MRGRSAFEHYRDFAGGVNYRALPTELPPNQYRGGMNITMNNIGKMEKRGGRTKLDATQFDAVHSLHKAATGTTSRLLMGAGTNLYDYVGGAFASLSAAMSGNPVSFAEFRGYTYVADGTNMLRYNMTDLQNWGIEDPTVAPTAADAGVGTFSASVGYSYKYTYYNSTTGYESAASAVASVGAFVTKAYVTVGYTASSDAQVSNIRIYRTTDGGTDYYLLTTVVNATSSYNDSVADATLQDNALFDAVGNVKPVGARYVCLHKKRLFTLNQTANTSRLAWSKLNEPEAFPDDYFEDIDEGYGGDGTGVVSYGDALIVAKTNVIWVLWGCENENSINWVKHRQIEDNGVIAPGSLIVANGFVFFIGKYGYVYRMGRDFNPIRISIDVDSLFDNVSETKMSGAVACDLGDGKLYFSVPSNTASNTNNLMLEYHTQFGAWGPYSEKKMISAMTVARNAVDNNEWYTGDTFGYVRLEGTGNKDDNVGFVASLESRYSSMGYPALFKKGWYLATEATMTVSGEKVTVTPRTRTGFTSTHELTHVPVEVWDGGWDGGWTSRNTNRIERQMVAQGLVGTHIAVDAESDAATGAIVFEGASLEYTIETT